MPNMSMTKLPMPEQDPKVRARNFEEVSYGYTEEMAVEEAQRCLNCKHMPCVSGCPVNVQIPKFISLIAQANLPMLALQSKRPALCRQFAVVYAHRKPSVKQNVSAASRVSRLQSVVWKDLLLTGI